jgi:hypothetical protein
MTTRPRLVFAARLAGTDVFDPVGDRVGKVRDVIVRFRPDRRPPQVVGFVVEVALRRRIFVPVTRVTSIASRQVITTGLINVRRFERRPGETLVLEDLLDRQVRLRDTGQPAVVFDLGLEPARQREWVLGKVAVQIGGGRFRRADTQILDWDQVDGWSLSERDQGAANLLTALSSMRAADLADVLSNLAPKRRAEVVAALEDERLADVLEELPEDDQVAILSGLGVNRAADVLDVDAARRRRRPAQRAAHGAGRRLLELMEPEEARDVRRLLAYEDDTAGGLMTTEPVILGPETHDRRGAGPRAPEDLTPALAARWCS